MSPALKIFVLLLSLSSANSVLADESPLTIDGAATVDTAKAKELFEQKFLFLDVRRDSDWQEGHISGAIHLEMEKMYSAKALGDLIKKNDPAVIYCNGPSCPRSAEASKNAVAWGFTKIYYYRDGIPAWKDAGLPIEH